MTRRQHNSFLEVRAQTRQELKKRGRLRVGLPLGYGGLLLSCHARCSLPRGQAGLLTRCARLALDGSDA